MNIYRSYSRITLIRRPLVLAAAAVTMTSAHQNCSRHKHREGQNVCDQPALPVFVINRTPYGTALTLCPSGRAERALKN